MNPTLVSIFDAIQYYLGSVGELKKLVWLKEDSDTSDTPASYLTSGSLGILCKCYFLGNAVGITAPPVSISAIEDMKKVEFRRFEVPDMSHIAGTGQIGHLCFAKTR